MTTIYLVYAAYSDSECSYTTNIKAFRDETKASLLVIELDEMLEKYHAEVNSFYDKFTKWGKENPQPSKTHKTSDLVNWMLKCNQFKTANDPQNFPEYADIKVYLDASFGVEELDLDDEE